MIRRTIAAAVLALAVTFTAAMPAAAWSWSTKPRHHGWSTVFYTYQYVGHSHVWRSPGGVRMCTDSHREVPHAALFVRPRVVTTGHHPC